ERGQMAVVYAVLLNRAVQKQASPSVRQAIIEDPEQAIKDRLRRCEDAAPEAQFQRRDLDPRVDESRVVFEQDAALAERQTADLEPLAAIKIDIEQVNGSVD